MQFSNVYGRVMVEADDEMIRLIPGGSSVKAVVDTTATSSIFKVGLTERSDSTVSVTADDGQVRVAIATERIDPLDSSLHIDRVVLTLSEATAATIAERLLDIESLDLNA